MAQMAFADTTIRSRHSLRIEPINRSAYAFCQVNAETSGP
jgi:hypothetical protein